MRKLILISSLLVTIFFTGCGDKTPEPLYSWGDYVQSSANYGMYGERKEVLEQHLAELKKIIDTSAENNQRVAPGIYAEYAQLLYKTNKKEDAKSFFLLEKKTYPSSSSFIDRIIKMLYGENS